MLSFLSFLLYDFFHMYSFIIFGQLKGPLANKKTHMRDVTGSVNSIGYGLFAVIKALFSNRNYLELIMNNIQTIVSMNINKIEKKYDDGVRTQILHASRQAMRYVAHF